MEAFNETIYLQYVFLIECSFRRIRGEDLDILIRKIRRM
jgi:hypothetical protein